MATRTTRTGAGIIFALALLLGSALALGSGHGTAYAADGDLDPNFGVGGKVQIPSTHIAYAWAVAIQADGKIVVVGAEYSLETGEVEFFDGVRRIVG